MNKDERLEKVIREAMIADKRLSAQPIHIAVHDGAVSLTGTVQSFRRAAAAVRMASLWPGVREVVNALRVEPPGVLTDTQIAENVRAALESSENIAKPAITVAVSAGIVTLQGSVADTWQRSIAEDVARGARGVRDVRNLLVASLSDMLDDDETASQIADAIKYLCGAAAAGIRVAVSGTRVVLSGTVQTFAQNEAARDVVRQFGCPSTLLVALGSPVLIQHRGQCGHAIACARPQKKLP